jgi:hypothetical protein
MIVCEQFVFVHLPKTGGTFVRDTLKEHAHRAWKLQERPGHHPARAAPKGRPILGVIRNPWDWYVSTYFFRRHHILNGTGAWAKPMEQWPPRVAPGMAAWARIMRELPDGRVGFLKALRILTGEDGSDPVIVPGHEGEGSLSRRCQDFLCDERGSDLCYVIRTEELRAGVEEFLDMHSVPVRRSLRRALQSAPKKNTAPRGHYRSYYDDEARDLVARVDCAIIERYGYEF